MMMKAEEEFDVLAPYNHNNNNNHCACEHDDDDDNNDDDYDDDQHTSLISIGRRQQQRRGWGLGAAHISSSTSSRYEQQHSQVRLVEQYPCNEWMKKTTPPKRTGTTSIKRMSTFKYVVIGTCLVIGVSICTFSIFNTFITLSISDSNTSSRITSIRIRDSPKKGAAANEVAFEDDDGTSWYRRIENLFDVVVTAVATFMMNGNDGGTSSSSSGSSIYYDPNVNANNDKIIMDEQINLTKEEEQILYKKAIQANTNVSLYRNYQEYATRKYRFPSVEERVKLYMSNWYVPPILPCQLNSNNDPRIQYNYIATTHPVTNETMIQVVLQQSQHINDIDHNFYSHEIGMDRTIVFVSDIIPIHSRLPFVYNETTILQKRNDRFVQDIIKYFIPSLYRIQYSNHTTFDGNVLSSSSTTPPPPPPIPILFQMGDAEQFRFYSPNLQKDVYRPFIPVIKKFRYSLDKNELQRITTIPKTRNKYQKENGEICDKRSVNRIQQPDRIAQSIRIGDPFMSDYINDRSKIPLIVQPVISIMSNYERHFNPLNDIVAVDIPWSQKKNMAIYRAGLTGVNRKTTVKHVEDDEVSEILWCQEIPRCNVVYQHGASKYVDAKLIPSKVRGGDHRVNSVLGNVTMLGEKMNYEQMLKYKAIIMLEGNDVSTGLKWSLYSNSVVMAPKPTCTSWAMEEMLIPYVHYIPLYDNLTNVEEQVQWMIAHDKEAEQIAYNGKLWMTDLVYHPDVQQDTEDIIDETFRRYLKHFRYNPDLQLPK